MLPFRCAALGLAAAGLLLLAAPAARAEPAAGDWREARTLPDLVETLNLWLDAHSPGPRRDAPVDVLMNAPIPPGSDMARASRAGAVPRSVRRRCCPGGNGARTRRRGGGHGRSG